MKIKLANKIDSLGLELFDDTYVYGEDIENEDAILLRSASLHEYSFPSSVKVMYTGLVVVGLTSISCGNLTSRLLPRFLFRA